MNPNWVIPERSFVHNILKKKQLYSQPDRILIDDHEDNIREWREKGGIGILHTSAQDTIKQLQNLGL